MHNYVYTRCDELARMLQLSVTVECLGVILVGVEKMVFKVLVFYGFLKTKNLERSDFFGFFNVFF